MQIFKVTTIAYYKKQKRGQDQALVYIYKNQMIKTSAKIYLKNKKTCQHIRKPVGISQKKQCCIVPTESKLAFLLVLQQDLLSLWLILW